MSRIVYLVTSSVSVTFLRGQLGFMRRRGYEVFVMSSAGAELHKVAEEEGVVAVEVPLGREICPLKDGAALWHLVRQFRSLRPDVVVAATPKAGLLGMLAARLAGVDVRVYHHFGLRLETTHGLKRFVLAMAERVACACATRVVCISESLRARCVELGLVRARKATVLGSGSNAGIDADCFQMTPDVRRAAAGIRLRLGIPADAPVVGFVGRLTRDKGVVDLLAALRQVLWEVPEARLLVLGEFEDGDPLPASCVRELKTHPQIVVAGFVEDPLPYYGVMDVLAFPSYREGFGCVALEAASIGLPVAGYRSTGVVDSVADGVTGTLVERGDSKELGKVLVRYLQSPELRRKHGEAGRRRAVHDFRREDVWGALDEEIVSLQRQTTRRRFSYRVKRVMDFVAAGMGLLLLAPVLALIALAIRATMGRPVFFCQQRPGLDGRPFGICKFRTMRDARDEQGRELSDTVRLTRLGRLLRNTSLDELPELINVVLGQMSLVGPRPLLMEYLDRYSAEQARRHDVVPGITGLAQVNGRNGISWEEKFRLDVRYVDHWSLWLDFRILLTTLWKVVRREGIDAGSDVTMPEFLGTEEKTYGKPAEGSSKPVLAAAPPRRIYLSPPHMSPHERELLLDAFDSNWIAPLGPHVDALEREFAAAVGAECAVALSSGTAALHLALMVLGVGADDEVATATMTFAATANAIRYVGATPVLIDCQPDTWGLDPELLAEELEAGLRRGRPLKAVLAVDLLGHCADYDPIRRLCRFYEIPLIEDAAEALGATYGGRAAGTLGDIGCFSFNGNKIITASGGGMLVTGNRSWADKARYLATQARDACAHYQHSAVGYNYRMSNLLAAVGRGQLQVLGERVQKRRANYEFYREALGELPGIRFLPEHPKQRATQWLSCILVDAEEFGATREDIRLALERENIESRAVWKPMHLQPVYAGCRCRGGEVAERLFEEGLCLPSGSSLSRGDIGRVVDIIRGVARSGKAAREHSSRRTAGVTGSLVTQETFLRSSSKLGVDHHGHQ